MNFYCCYLDEGHSKLPHNSITSAFISLIDKIGCTLYKFCIQRNSKKDVF